MSAAQWGESFARCIGLLLTDKNTGHRLLMIFNASRESIDFSVPPVSEASIWFRKLDTSESLASDAVPDVRTNDGLVDAKKNLDINLEF